MYLSVTLRLSKS